MNTPFTLVLITSLTTTQTFAYQPMRGRTVETYNEWKEKTKTPEAMNEFMNNHLHGIPDSPEEFVNHRGEKKYVGHDYMYEPIDIYLRGGGDCEDYAALAADWLRYHGYETHIILFGECSHAACAVRNGATWSYLGTDGYFSGYKNLETLIRQNAISFEKSLEMLPDTEAESGYVVVPLSIPIEDRTMETYTALRESSNTPSQVYRFLKELRIFYPMTKLEHRTIKQPHYTYLYNGGNDSDCTALAVDWLLHHGYETKFISYTTGWKDDWFICVVKEGKTWSYVSIAAGYNTGYKSIEDLLEDETRRHWVGYKELLLDFSQSNCFRIVHEVSSPDKNIREQKYEAL